MLDRRRFLVLTSGLLAGCGQPHEPPVEPAVAISANASLTPGDVRTFLEIVRRLPGEKLPAFQPVSEVDLTLDSDAQAMAARWQREFRSSYSPSIQARLWKRDSRLRQALADCGVEPEPFAALLVKMSTAVVRESLGAEIDLAELGRQADRAIESLCSQLNGLDGDPRLSPAVRNARAELLTAVLKESVAYREFLRLLEDVPAESVAAVSGQAETLRQLMPTTETLIAFEKKLRSQPKVMKASHEARARVSAPR